LTEPDSSVDTRGTNSAAADSVVSRAGRGVHHLGYRGWTGRLAPGWMRWTVISAIGVRRGWQSMWLRRMLFFAWLPSIGFGLGFFFWEQSAVNPEMRQALVPLSQAMPPTPSFEGLRDAVRSGNTSEHRHLVWAWLLLTFFRYPQGVLMVLVIGMIFPPLISQDIRSRAFLLYFSRPLARAEYMLGKLATLWVYLALISTLPALTLYVLGLFLSPDLSVFRSTWDIPFRILGASIVLMLPTSALALCFSSLTQESRYAGFAWFVVWVLGWFTFIAATGVETMNAQRAASMRHNGVPVMEETAWTHLSLYHTLGRVQAWVFGFADFPAVLSSLLLLCAVTVLSLLVLMYRVSAPTRA
jgi:hypothetical protein